MKKQPAMLSMELPDNAPWKPLYYTKPLKNTHSRGFEIYIFTLVFLSALRGAKIGEKIQLMAWQVWLTNNIFETKPDGSLRYSQVLLMIPRKNGKTFLASLYLLYHLLTAPRAAEIYSAAGSRDQARIVFENCKNWIELSPALSKMLEVKDSRNTIINRKTKATYKALSSDGNKAHGLAPYFVCCDELSKWDGASAASKRAAKELFNALEKGSIDQPSSQMVIISTAGDYIDDSLLGSVFKRGVSQYLSEKEKDAQGAFGFFCWMAEDTDDPLEPETWKKANPSMAEGIVSEEKMAENLAGAVAVSISSFLRDHLNIWASISGDPYIQPYIWKNAVYKGDEDAFYPGCPVVVGFDASKRGDSSAIVIQTVGDDESQGGVFKVWEVWERPENPPEGWHISRTDVEASMRKLHEVYDVKAIWADKFYYESSLVEWMEKYDWDIELIPQTRERKDRYAREFRADLIEGEIFHIDEEAMNRHIGNTVLDRMEGFSKPPGSSRQKIDLFVAAMLANAGRNFILNQDEPEPQFLMGYR